MTNNDLETTARALLEDGKALQDEVLREGRNHHPVLGEMPCQSCCTKIRKRRPLKDRRR